MPPPARLQVSATYLERGAEAEETAGGGVAVEGAVSGEVGAVLAGRIMVRWRFSVSVVYSAGHTLSYVALCSAVC